MMSKKMKRVAFDSSPHVLYDDVNARARFKHQTLLQDFLELQQETEDARNKLMALKQRKLTLQAEVRFLRKRHKFLLKEKSSSPQEQVSHRTQFAKSKKEMDRSKKQTTLRKLPPIVKKEKAPRTITSPEFDLNLGISLHGVKEQSIHRGIANQRVRINGPKVSPFQDLTQNDPTCIGQEFVVQTQKPVIDLNQISSGRSREKSQLTVHRWKLLFIVEVLFIDGTVHRQKKTLNDMVLMSVKLEGRGTNAERLTALERAVNQMIDSSNLTMTKIQELTKAVSDLTMIVKESKKKPKKPHYGSSSMMKFPQQQAQTSRPPLPPTMAMPTSTNDTQPLIQSGLVFYEHEFPIPPFQEGNSEKVGRRLIFGLGDTKPVTTTTIVSKGNENKEEREKKVLLIEEKTGSIGRKRTLKDIVDEGGDQAIKILSADQSEKLGFHLGQDPTQPNGDFLYFFYPP